jgi:hypothetical protein
MQKKKKKKILEEIQYSTITCCVATTGTCEFWCEETVAGDVTAWYT